MADINALIALGGQPIDFGGSMQRGIEGRQKLDEIARNNALTAFIQQNGPGIAAGDPNALAGLAQFDPNAARAITTDNRDYALKQRQLAQDYALRLRQLGQTDRGLSQEDARSKRDYALRLGQLAQDYTLKQRQLGQADRGLSQDDARIKLAQEAGAREAEAWAAGKPIRDVETHVAQLKDAYIRGQQAMQSPEAWAEYVKGTADTSDDAVPFEQAPGVIGMMEGALQVLGGGGGMTINNNLGEDGRTAYVKERAKNFATDAQTIQTEANAARKTMTSLDVMESTMSDPGFYSGTGNEKVMALKRMAASMGIDPDGVSSMETFGAFAKQAALDSMGGSLGAGFSNADRDFVTGQVPSLDNTPAGNARLIDVTRKIQERKLEVAQMARDYERANGMIDAGFWDEVEQFAKANPVFAGDRTGIVGSRAPEGDPRTTPARNFDMRWDPAQGWVTQ